MLRNIGKSLINEKKNGLGEYPARSKEDKDVNKGVKTISGIIGRVIKLLNQKVM